MRLRTEATEREQSIGIDRTLTVRAKNVGVCRATSLLVVVCMWSALRCGILWTRCAGRGFWRWCVVGGKCVGLSTFLDEYGEKKGDIEEKGLCLGKEALLINLSL